MFYIFLTCACGPPLWKRFRHPCIHPNPHVWNNRRGLTWSASEFGWARVTEARRLGSIPGRDLKNDICGLSSLALGSDGWVQGKRFARGTSTDSPPVQRSLRKQARDPRSGPWKQARDPRSGPWRQARDPRCKEAEMGAADHSRLSEKKNNIECKRSWTAEFWGEMTASTSHCALFRHKPLFHLESPMCYWSTVPKPVARFYSLEGQNTF